MMVAIINLVPEMADFCTMLLCVVIAINCCPQKKTYKEGWTITVVKTELQGVP
jgi:hypothetical protein